MTSKLFLQLFLVLLLASGWGCARSGGYRKDSVTKQRKQSQTERERIIGAAENFNILKKRAVVLPFWNDTPVKGKFEVQAKNALKDVLLEQSRINLVDEKEVSLRSQDFYLDSEKINVAHIAENGQKWGVSLVIVGRISKIVFRKKDDQVGLLRPSSALGAANVELRMVDVSQGKEIAFGEGVGKSESSDLNLFGGSSDDTTEWRDSIVSEAIADAIYKAMPALNREMDRIQWRGKIAKIDGQKYYVNAGRATGIGIGDILKVSGKGQDIFDPDSGIFMGRTQGDLKGTLEVVDYFGEDAAIARLHSGSSLQEGDIIQLY